MNIYDVLVVAGLAFVAAAPWVSTWVKRLRKGEPIQDEAALPRSVPLESSDWVPPELEAARAQIANLERMNREYFKVIEGIEKERDIWKEWHLTASGEHAEAQSMLQNVCAQLGQQLGAAVRQLNVLRELAGLEKVKEPRQLSEIPTTVADDFRARVKARIDGMAPAIDGKAEREKIATSETAP